MRAFLGALERGDADAAAALLHEDVVYTNVSLPEMHGRRSVRRLVEIVSGRGIRFRVHYENVAERDGVVLTERIDAVGIGRFEPRFWVYGRFEVADGMITVWRDSFDWLDIFRSIVRAGAGVFSARLNRPWPERP